MKKDRPSAFRGVAGVLLAVLLTVNVCVLWSVHRQQARSRLESHFWLVCHGGATAEQRRDAFTALVQAGNHQWRGARLQHLKLRGIDLAGAELEMIDLEGSDLTDGMLSKANLRAANLQLTVLAGADLSAAALAESYLRKADLTSANLRGADLRSASLEQTDLIGTDLEEADLTEANLLLAVLTGASLKDAQLAWATLDAADFTGADLAGADLTSASIQDTYFGQTNWWRATGLSTATIQRFKKDFAPGEEDPVDLQKDYQEWLSGQSQ